MKSKLLFIAAVILFFASCKTGSNFTSRRYMAGHYKANHAHVNKPEAQKTAYSSKKNSRPYESAEVLLVQPEAKPDGLMASNDVQKKIFTEKKHKCLKEMPEIASKRAPKLSTIVKEIFSKPVKTNLKSGADDGKISQKALTGFICGVGAVAIDVICFIIAIGAVSYAPLAGMFVGLVLGILGIIFGTQGIRDYRSSRSTPTLVFGIVGAATGLIGIILAFYLGIYGAILVYAYGSI